MKSWDIDKNLLRAEFGIEKESLRVDASGYLAATSHPALSHPQISRDFGESQVEFISGVYDNLQDACMEICRLQQTVEDAIRHRGTGAEFLWTYSNPPLFRGEGSIQIAEFAGVKENKTAYREYLAGKYGKVKMLFSGLHLNYSMPKEFFEQLQNRVSDHTPARVRNEWYVRLCDIMMEDSWLIVALTAASPVADQAFLDGLLVPETKRKEYASFRNSEYGYWNLFLPELSYRDFSSYLESIRRYIESGEIRSIQELYYPIRLKPAGENSFENLMKNGVNHMELRMLDLNPMCCAGVAIKDLVFIHLLIAYRTAGLLAGWNKRKCNGPDRERILLHKKAARFSFWEENEGYRRRALHLIRDMKRFYAAYEKNGANMVPNDYDIEDALDFEEQKILDPESRWAVRIRKKYKDDFIKTRMGEIGVTLAGSHF